MHRFVQGFVKATAAPVAAMCFKTKVHYEDKRVQNRKIKGAAIIVSNHTSVYDFAAYMFVFFSRTVRCLMAEVLFEKRRLGRFLKSLGGIKVDRNAFDFGFVDECCDILARGGVLEIFPESRIPLPNEARPLEFKPSAAYIALLSGAPVIPVYTDGCYFKKKRSHVIIGKPLDVSQMFADEQDERVRLEKINGELRNTVIRLGNELERQKQKTK